MTRGGKVASQGGLPTMSGDLLDAFASLTVMETSPDEVDAAMYEEVQERAICMFEFEEGCLE